MKNKLLDFSNVEIPQHIYANLYDDMKLMPLYTNVGLVEFKKFFAGISNRSIYQTLFNNYSIVDLTTVERYLNGLPSSQVNDLDGYSDTIKQILDQALGLFLDKQSFDSFVKSWWKHKRNFYSVLSTLDGWNEKNLAVTISQKYNTSIDWYTATVIFLSLVYKPWHSSPRGLVHKNYSHSSYAPPITDFIRDIIIEAFRLLVLDDINIPKRDVLTKDIFSSVGGDKICYKSQRQVLKHLQEYPVSIQTADGKYENVFESKFGVSFSKVSEIYFNQIISDLLYCDRSSRSSSNLKVYDFFASNFRSHADSANELVPIFTSALYSFLGAHKPETTKLMVVKKLLNFFTPLAYGSTRDYVDSKFPKFQSMSFVERVQLIESPALSFKSVSEYTLNESDVAKNFRVPFKVKLRTPDNTGFVFEEQGSYNQLFAKLVECFSSTVVSDDYLISLHPMSMFFSSYGTTFTSCHNVLTFTSNKLIDKYRRPDNTGNWFKGNYEAAAGGGFVVVVPSAYLPEKQWSVPSHTRFALWMSDNLDVMRMHLSYPGKPTDGEAKAEAKAIRVMIHELLAPWHGVGTSAWKSKDINADVRGFRDRIDLSDDKYASDVLFNMDDEMIDLASYTGYTSEPIWSYSYFNGPGSPSHYPLCIGVQSPPLNKNLSRYHGYYYTTTSSYSESSYNIVKPVSVVINGETILLSSKDLAFARDASRYVLSPKTLHLSKYHSILVSNLDGYHQCSSCKKHFVNDYMKDSTCLDHVPTATSNMFSSLVAQPDVDVYFSYRNKDELMGFLINLNKFDQNIKWKNSSSLTSFVPDGNFVLSLVGKYLVLKMPNFKPQSKVYNVVDVVF